MRHKEIFELVFILASTIDAGGKLDNLAKAVIGDTISDYQKSSILAYDYFQRIAFKHANL